MPVNLQFTIPTPTADGVYPYAIPVPAGLPPAQALNVIARTGFANWGPVGQPQFYNTLAQAIYLWGDSANIVLTKNSDACTGNNGSLVGATQAANPEGSSFCDVRVTDGSDAHATSLIVDASAGTIATLTATFSGTDGNSITQQVSIYQGQFAASGSVIPMVQLIVKINSRPTWTSVPFVVGTSSAGYVKATFLANLQTALLGTYGSGGTVCPYLTYTSSGSSSLAPVVTAQTASGGLSGYAFSSSSISSVLIGSNTQGSPTGIYALQGISFGLLHCVGNTDLTTASTLASFAQSNTCLAVIADKFGTSTATAIADKNTNNVSSPWLVFANDFTFANDAVDGTGGQYMDPACKVAAIISQQPPWYYPGNKPYVGAQNLIGTYRTQANVPYSNAELGNLEQNGILIITKPISRGAVFGLAHGMASDGATQIPDTRMLNKIANDLTAIMGAFVGELQTPPPAAGVIDTDITRGNARRAVSAYFGALMNPANPAIAAWDQIMDGTNNTSATVAAGYLYDRIEVTTLAGIRFILLGLQVGETVTVDTAN